MILDKELLLSDEQAVTATAVSTNTIDLSAALRDIGAGEQIYAVVVVDVDFAAAGAATMVIGLITDDDEALSSPTTILSTPAIGKAALTAGRVPIVIPVPPNIAERYLGLNYTVATGPMTAGKVTAFIAKDVQTNL